MRTAGCLSSPFENCSLCFGIYSKADCLLHGAIGNSLSDMISGQLLFLLLFNHRCRLGLLTWPLLHSCYKKGLVTPLQSRVMLDICLFLYDPMVTLSPSDWAAKPAVRGSRTSELVSIATGELLLRGSLGLKQRWQIPEFKHIDGIPAMSDNIWLWWMGGCFKV